MPFNDIRIENYTAKSFVVRGNTQVYKSSFQALEGKWNDRLTDRSTGDKFGGWIFPMGKKETVEEWINKGEHLSAPASKGGDPELRAQVNALRSRVEELEKKLELVMGQLEVEYTSDDSEEAPKQAGERKSFLL